MSPPKGEQKQNFEAGSDAARAGSAKGGTNHAAAAQNAISGGLGVLGKLSGLSNTEKPAVGFAKLPEKTKIQEYMEHLSAQEKLALLKGALKEKPLTPQQKFLIKKTGRLHEFARALQRDFANPHAIEINLYIAKWMKEKYAGELRNPKILMPSDLKKLAPRALAELQKPQQWFEKHGTELMAKIATGQLTDIEGAIPEDVRAVLDRFTDSKNIKTEADLYAYEARRIDSMRMHGEYQTASDEMEDLLGDELKAGRKFLGEAWISKIKAQVARGEIFRLYIDHQDEWRAAGMTEEQIQEYYNGMLKMEEEHEINKRIAEHILGKKVAIPPEKQAIYNQYMDMHGLGPWHNLRDEQWDTITKELLINMPLILASGGIAAAARGGLSKIALQWLEKNGAKWFGKKLLEKTTPSKAITTTARIGAGMFTEGTLFEATHGVLTGGLSRSLPEWGKAILWSSITLGAFHGTGRLTEGFFSKEVGGVRISTKLGAAVEKISDRAVQEVVKTLLVKGHAEAATMIIIGAIQHGAYVGNIEDFFTNGGLGDEIFHAYVTVGALKIGGKIHEVLRAKEPRVQETTVEKSKAARELQPAEVNGERASRTPTIAKEFDLETHFTQARGMIEAHTKAKDATLTPDEIEIRVRTAWEQFLERVERVRVKLRFIHAENLLDFVSKFSQEDGTDISTWEKRLAYADALLRKIDIGTAVDTMNKLSINHDLRIKNLPREAPGPNDKKAVLKRIQEALSPEEIALPQDLRQALVRSLFYHEMSKLSKKAGIIMDNLESYVRRNPDATFEGLLAEAKKQGFDELPGETRKKMKIAMLRFEHIRTAMRLALQSFTPAELFEKIFKIKPFKEVAIDASTPFSIRFLLDPSDYVRIAEDGMRNLSLTEAEQAVNDGKISSGGMKFNRAGDLPMLNGLITAIPTHQSAGKIEATGRHEDRHAMYDVFFSLGERFGDKSGRLDAAYDSLKAFRDEFTDARNDVERGTFVEQKFPALLEKLKRGFLDSAKDEIVAYLKEGISVDGLRRTLLKKGTEALYDYTREQKALVFGKLPEAFSKIGERFYRRMEAQYARDLNRAINMAGALFQDCRTPEEQSALLGELGVTPIEAWEALFKSRDAIFASHGNETIEFDAVAKKLTVEAERWIASAKLKDDSYLTLGAEDITYKIKTAAFDHDMVKLFEKGKVFEAIKALIGHNIDVIQNYKENTHTQTNRENGLVATIREFIDAFPPDVGKRIADAIMPEIERIQDPVLREQCKAAAAFVETMPLAIANESQNRNDTQASAPPALSAPELTRERLKNMQTLEVDIAADFGPTLEALKAATGADLQPRTDGHHLTIIGPTESKVLSTLDDATLNELQQINQHIQNGEGVTVKGIGFIDGASSPHQMREVDKVKKTAYVAFEIPELQAFRAKIGLPPKDFHVTLGFVGGDIHTRITGQEQIKPGSPKMKDVTAPIPKQAETRFNDIVLPQISYGGLDGQMKERK